MFSSTSSKGETQTFKSVRNKVIQGQHVFTLCRLAEMYCLLQCSLSLGHLFDGCISPTQPSTFLAFLSLLSLWSIPLIHLPSSLSLSHHSLLLLLFVRRSIYRSSSHLFTVIHPAWGKSRSTLRLDTIVFHQSMNNLKQLPHQGTLQAWNCLSIVL